MGLLDTIDSLEPLEEVTDNFGAVDPHVKRRKTSAKDPMSREDKDVAKEAEKARKQLEKDTAKAAKEAEKSFQRKVSEANRVSRLSYAETKISFAPRKTRLFEKSSCTCPPTWRYLPHPLLALYPKFDID